jgi:hypothetical protein
MRHKGAAKPPQLCTQQPPAMLQGETSKGITPPSATNSPSTIIKQHAQHQLNARVKVLSAIVHSTQLCHIQSDSRSLISSTTHNMPRSSSLWRATRTEQPFSASTAHLAAPKLWPVSITSMR